MVILNGYWIISIGLILRLSFFIFFQVFVFFLIIIILFVWNFFLLGGYDLLHHFTEERLILFSFMFVSLFFVMLSWWLHLILNWSLQIKAIITVGYQINWKRILTCLFISQIELEFFQILIEVEVLQKHDSLAISSDQVPTFILQKWITWGCTEIALSVWLRLKHNLKSIKYCDLTVTFSFYESIQFDSWEVIKTLLNVPSSMFVQKTQKILSFTLLINQCPQICNFFRFLLLVNSINFIQS